MKIRFVTPPLAKQAGGIENAVEGLRKALHGCGIEVVDGGDADDADSLHHFHGLWDPAHSRLAAHLRRRGAAYVVSPHGMLEPWAFRNRRWKKLPYFHLLEKRMLAGAAALFVTSGMERDNLSRLLMHPRVEVLPLGCRDTAPPDYGTARQRLGWKDDERVMVFLSRVDPKKGLDLLFEALAATDLAARKWRLVIVGDGPPAHREALGRLEQRLAATLPPIDWVGPVWGARRWSYLQGADLFCLPTHSENFGIAVLEAFHVGTPVLTTTGTPWADFREMDGVFIAAPAIEPLRAALVEANRRIELGWTEADRMNLSQWAARNFSWEHLAGRYLAAYAGAMNAAPPAAESSKTP